MMEPATTSREPRRPAIDNVEAVYPLSPMQHGMLVDSLVAPASGVYLQQLAWSIRGPLDPVRLRAAWQRTLDRHPALRARFLWDGVKEPVQVIRRRLPLPWSEQDWRGRPEARSGGARKALEAALAEERGLGFDEATEPLLRLRLIRLEDELYELIWSYSHLVLDGWSMALVVGEVWDRYRALGQGEEPELPPPRPYGDYIAWLRGRRRRDSERFWRDRLSGLDATTALDLPAADGELEAGPGHDEVHHLLSAAATQALKELARGRRLTLATLVQAAWALLLSACGAGDDVVFGSVVSGRPRELDGVESMVGLFINTVPLRVEVAPGAELVDWLRELQDRAVELREHEHTALVEVQAWSELPAGRPLFETLLAFENYSLEGGAPADVGLEIRNSAVFERSSYPLAVVAGLAGSAAEPRLALKIAYRRDRYGRRAVERAGDHLRRLLESMPAGAGGRVGALPMLSAGQRHQLLVEWNDTRGSYDPEAAVPALFARRARERPDAVALVCGGRSVSYGRLANLAAAATARLSAAGVTPGVRVGVVLERSPETIALLLGILGAGAAYVPLEVDTPPERLRWILDATGVRAVVTGSAQATADAAAPGRRVLELDRVVDPAATVRAGAAVPPVAGGDALAYVMFTSGSTGRPKGVAVPHRGVIRLVDRPSYLTFGTADVFLQFAPLGFDASTLEVWGPLLNGARLVIMEPGPSTLEDLGAAVERHGVSTLWLTTGLFNQAVERVPEALAVVRRLLTGGESPSPPHLRTAVARLGGRLIHCYGPTENTTFSTCHPLPAAPPPAAPVPIGGPITGTTVYVLDRWLRPVPPGIEGDLYTGGDGLARGYFGQGAQTAARFVPDPFGPPGARLYRTGDRARWNAAGALEFRGRRDHQIKLRGFRIELGEIEAVLADHPRVDQCAVLVRGEGAHRHLAGHVATAGGAELAAGDLEAFLGRSLPPYMVPRTWSFLDRLPLTASGKVDRRRLAELGSEAGESRRESPVAPSNATERTVAEVWEEVLAREGIGVDDDFFELGGNSLLVTQVASRLRRRLGVELPLRALFEAPTVARLAAAVAAASGAEAGGEAIRPRPRAEAPGAEAAPPASFAQRRLWFLHRMDPWGAAYNVPAAVGLRGWLRTGVLRRALAEIVRRHEVLRTTFAVRDGDPVQSIEPPRFRLPLVDLAACRSARREPEAHRIAARDGRRPFDLAAGPVLRGALVRLAPDHHRLHLTVHHVAFDGWSAGVLVGELAALYRAFSAGRPSPLPEPPIQYADYALWQRERLSGAVLERELEHWRRRLADAPPLLELTGDRPRPPAQSFRGGSCRFEIPPALAAGLRRLGRERRATLFMVLLAALDVLLHRCTGARDLVIGAPVANRERVELEGLIGFFVNTLLMRTRIEGDPAFGSLVDQVRDVALEAYAHQELPFEKLVEELQPRRSLSHAPLAQVVLSLQNAPRRRFELPGLTVEPVPVEAGTAKLDLDLFVVEAGDRLHATLEYNADLFDRTTAQRLVGHLATLLAGVVERPGAPLSALPLLSPAERHALVAEAGPTLPGGGVLGAGREPAETLHGRFARCVARQPDAVALEQGDRRLSYGELARRGGRLARSLVRRGVRPGDRVAICLEPSCETVIAMLGVLGAGAAYLPLDPVHPAERLRATVADAGAVLLLTRDAAALGPLDPALPTLDPAAAASDEENGGRAPAAAASPDHPAYVIYTSGSTGRPKGVVVEHRRVLRLLAATEPLFGFGTGDVWTLAHSFAFDFSVWELWGALLSGGRVVMLDRDGRAPDALHRALAERRVTVLNQTPSAFQQLLRHETSLAGRAPELALRWVVFGGEALAPGSLSGWFDRHGDRRPRLVNMYGITETTVHVSHRPLDRSDAGRPGSPIGRALPHLGLLVLDERLEPAPVGVVGEIHVAGAGVASGYLGRPRLTAERFVPDPFGGRAGARLYRSGDLALRRPNGDVEYVGRRDHQVQLRGYRVELGEIEAVLSAHPEVEECAVVAHGEGGDPRLAAFVVGTAAVDSLPEHLGRRLPAYMVPALWIPLDRLPLTATGKVDRRRLAATVPERLEERRGERVPPRTDGERAIAEIWEEVLEVPGVGAEESFFDLGGHSLSAAQVVSRIRERLGVEVPLRRLFDAPTVAGLAAAVAEARQGDGGAPRAIRARPRDRPRRPLDDAPEPVGAVDGAEGRAR